MTAPFLGAGTAKSEWATRRQTGARPNEIPESLSYQQREQRAQPACNREELQEQFVEVFWKVVSPEL